MSGDGHLLPTSRDLGPDGTNTDHLHRGGLVVVYPATADRLSVMTWVPDRLYRLRYCDRNRSWFVDVDDDLRWVAVARVLVVASDIDNLDAAATPDGSPLLCRDDTYLVHHERYGTACQMTLLLTNGTGGHPDR